MARPGRLVVCAAGLLAACVVIASAGATAQPASAGGQSRDRRVESAGGCSALVDVARVGRRGQRVGVRESRQEIGEG